MSSNDSASVMDGLFYGGAAYIFSYLFVYLSVLRSGGVKERIATEVLGKSATSPGEASAALELLIPGGWKYAGWLYHYINGGSIGVTINLFPGTYPVKTNLLFPQMNAQVEKVRHTILTNPMQLPEVVSVVESYSALTLLTVTPTSLFLAGALLAYRNNDVTPLGGAIAGGKVTAGYLLLSVAGVYVFTSSISGFSVSGSGALSLQTALEIIAVEFQSGVELGGGASVNPVIEIGPSLGRAVLSGFFYPLIFGTLGGAAGAKAGVVKAPFNLLDRLK